MRPTALAVLALVLSAACGKKEEPKPAASAAPAAPAVAQSTAPAMNTMDPRQYAGFMKQAQETANKASAEGAQKQNGMDQANQAEQGQ